MKIEYRQELVSNTSPRNLIIDKDDLLNYIDPTKDCYSSLFYYNDDMANHVKTVGSVSGYKGIAGIARLVFDMDNIELVKAQEDAKSLIAKLQTEYDILDNEIGIYFSGHKGFAIELSTIGLFGFDQLTENIPLFTKRVCMFLAQEFSSWDRVVYNVSRLFRLNNTRHQKPTKLGGIETNLFKVQISKDMLFNQSAEDIKRYATAPRVAFNILPISSPAKLNIDIERVFNGVVTQQTIEKPIKEVNYICDDSKCPKNMKYCIWLIEQGEYTDNRDSALLIIAANDKKTGVQKEVSRAKLAGILELMNQKNPQKAIIDPITEDDLDRLIRQAYNNDYDIGCRHTLLESICKDKCFLYKAKFNMSKVGTISLLEAYTQSTEFFRDYYENLVPTGIKILDDNMPLFKGTNNILVGKKGTGKTSLVLNIIKNTARLKIPVIFFNMDMSEPLTIAKLGSILLADIAQKSVISTKDFMESHTRKKYNGEFQKRLTELSEWVSICSKRGLSVQDIMSELDNQEKINHKKYKLLIIDHVQLLESKSSKEYERNTQNARLFSDLAKTRNICVLGLSHAIEGPDGRLMALGTRTWEHEAHSQINVYRPFQHKVPDKDHYLMLQLEKNRLGTTDTFELYYDGASGWCRELTTEETVEYDKIKNELEGKKHKDKY